MLTLCLGAASDKVAALEKAGAIVTDSPAKIGPTMLKVKQYLTTSPSPSNFSPGYASCWSCLDLLYFCFSCHSLLDVCRIPISPTLMTCFSDGLFLDEQASGFEAATVPACPASANPRVRSRQVTCFTFCGRSPVVRC